MQHVGAHLLPRVTPPACAAIACEVSWEECAAELRNLVEWGFRLTQPEAMTDAARRATDIVEAFTANLSAMRDALEADVDAVAARDPAAQSREEIICCYPAIVAMLHYRVAHQLHVAGSPLVPRMISERAHSLTGIDIHPAATIGKAFAVDHGTGIVIGATAIIGDRVMLYQGVTLGAKSIVHDGEGRPVDKPRHPIIEDGVTIYSNTTVLGRITIGHDSVIGGNLWITHDVEPYSTVRQHKPVLHRGFIDGDGI